MWQPDGHGRRPEFLIAQSSLSAVPEKPLGLYDPKFDKDSCGVGFVAELSGESSRKTVSFCLCLVGAGHFRMNFRIFAQEDFLFGILLGDGCSGDASSHVAQRCLRM